MGVVIWEYECWFLRLPRVQEIRDSIVFRRLNKVTFMSGNSLMARLTRALYQ